MKPENTWEDRSTASPVQSALGIVAAVCGWGLSHYCGIVFWIPMIGAFVASIILSKFHLGPPSYRMALGILAGHIFWLVLASFLYWRQTLPDAIMLTALAVWLFKRPNAWAVSALGLVELASLAYVVMLVIGTQSNSAIFGALVVHGVFRFAVLAALVGGSLKTRRPASGQLAPVPQTAPTDLRNLR